MEMAGIEPACSVILVIESRLAAFLSCFPLHGENRAALSITEDGIRTIRGWSYQPDFDNEMRDIRASVTSPGLVLFPGQRFLILPHNDNLHKEEYTFEPQARLLRGSTILNLE
jgi:hypothetical protein